MAGKGGGGGGNSNRYVLVTQDEELRRWGRGVRGLPMLYIRRSVLIMEPMSGVSRGAVGAGERAKLKEGIRGARGLKRAREPEEETEEEEVDGSVEADGEEGVTAPHQEEPRAPKDRASGDAQSRPVRKTKKQYGFKKSKVK